MAAVARGLAPRPSTSCLCLCLRLGGGRGGSASRRTAQSSTQLLVPVFARTLVSSASRRPFTLRSQTATLTTISFPPRRSSSSSASASSPASTTTEPHSTTTSRELARTSPVPIDSVDSAAYAAKLAVRPQPTLIYEAPSHALMFASYWAGAAMMVASMSVPSLMVLTSPPEGLSTWVLPAYNVIVASSFFIGAGIVYAGSGTVNKITALSSSKARQSQRFADSRAPLWLEIEVKRVVPFLRPYKLRAPVEKMSLEPGALAALLAIPPAQWAILRAETERLMAAEEKYDREHPVTRPVRHLWRAVTGFWRKVAYAVSRREFSKLKVYDKRLQIHTTGGWALEDGLALEKLFGEDRFKM